MNMRPKLLKSIDCESFAWSSELHGNAMRLKPAWDLVVTASLTHPNLLKFCADIYFAVLEQYQRTRKPVALQVISRAQNKRWQTLLRTADIAEDITLKELIMALELSHSVPLELAISDVGSLTMLPAIVSATIQDRFSIGVGPDNYIAVREGLELGPNLSPLGLEKAYGAFSDEVGPIAQKINAERMAAESLTNDATPEASVE